MRGCIIRAAALSVLALGLADAAQARLVSFTVERRDSAAPARPGAAAYEILRGRFRGELDPADPANAIITDIRQAPRNARGRVEYSATFAIALPADPKQASGVLVYDVPNRGNGDVAADPDGHVRVVSGWQGDIPATDGLQTAEVPVAAGLTGPAFARFTNMKAGTRSLPILVGFARTGPGPVPATLDTRRARLFRQSADDRPAIPIPPRDWAFGNCSDSPFPGTPDPGWICLRGGFDPRFAYGLAYTGKDPKVLGIGFAATRDLTAFLRHATADGAGTPNPVAGLVRWTVATGTSQSGNFLKSFLNLDFNADEQGRIVFDGMNPNIAARQLPMNIRFGVPGGAATLYELGSEGTLWWARYEDRARRRGTTSLLDRCGATGTCPKIVETFGAAELWGLRMSPNLVGTDARSDLPLPANVRRYYFPGVTHGGSRTGGFPTAGDPFAPGSPACVLPGNPNPSSMTLRALQKALVDWVRSGREPPASRYPTLAAGDLVEPTARAMGWPAIPGAPRPDGRINIFLDYDVGRGFDYPDLSGVPEFLPLRIRQALPSRVVRVDADGNEVAGVSSVQALVPLGTYTGWNVLAQGYGAGGGCSFLGGFIPFARTKAERIAARDPRPSLQERYRDHAGFVARVKAAAAQQVAAGWLLPDDAATLAAQAEASDVLKD
ncbi:hypothetical protein KXS07_35035 [Inquilinus limosus]|uniref:alpha/beta hydrolase domain-containing protein n=1 Tax=Inquilinus limosus TaxID=171674 RepID=UPI003F17B68C